jgi:hypothetical protein
MTAIADIPDYVGPVLGLGAVLWLISRVLRIARHNGPPDTATPPAPPRPLWGKARKVRLFSEDAALARAETEYLTSATDRLQARVTLDRLTAELDPAPAAEPPPAPVTPAALTFAEIDNLLHLVDLDEQTRADLMRLAAALIAEKRP